MTYERRSLTKRQEQLLICIADGGSSKDFANKYSISVRTADSTRFNLMKELGAHCVQDLVKYAILHNYIKLGSIA